MKKERIEKLSKEEAEKLFNRGEGGCEGFMNEKEKIKRKTAKWKRLMKEHYLENYIDADELTKVSFITNRDTVTFYEENGKLTFVCDTEKGENIAKKIIKDTMPITIVHPDPKGEATDGLERYSAPIESIYDIFDTKNGLKSWIKGRISTDGKCTIKWEGIKDGEIVGGDA